MAAVASIAVFAIIALTVLQANRASISAARAELGRASAEAAAEAGLAIALHELPDSAGAGLPLDGRVRHYGFDGADLAISIEDEQGKIPINSLEEEDVRNLLAALGLEGDRLDIAADSLLDWIDDDDDERPHGAEAPYYAAQGIRPRNGLLRSLDEVALIRPRNGLLRSLDEVALIRGFEPRMVGQLEEIATVRFGQGNFRADRARPIAIQIMLGETASAVDMINRQRVLDGQEVALDTEGTRSLKGRPFTVRVIATRPDGSRAVLRQVAILTGDPARPYRLYERY